MSKLMSAQRAQYPACVRAFKSVRYLCVIQSPDSAIHLYGSEASQADALIQARADHPLGDVLAQLENVSQARLEALRKPSDPLRQTLKDLGKQ